MLALAADPSLPLLERAKFLAIFASNLDEFYMVRVAGPEAPRRDGAVGAVRRRSVPARATAPHRRAHPADRQPTRQGVPRFGAPALAEEGILIVTWAELDEDERERLSTYFNEQVFPVLTPLAVDPAHPFPFVSGLSLNLAVTVKQPEDGTQHFARIKVPDNVDRFVELDAKTGENGTDGQVIVRFLPTEELIAAFLPMLFPGMEIVEHHAFRITRNADFEVEEDRDEDLLQALERELARRRFGSPVRLEVADDMTESMMEFLLRELDVHPGDVIECLGCWICRRCGRSTEWTGQISRTGCSFPPPIRPLPTGKHRRASSRPCAKAMCWFTIRTTRSRPACSASSNWPPRTRMSSRSSRRCTAPRVIRRSSGADRRRRGRKASGGNGRDQGALR